MKRGSQIALFFCWLFLYRIVLCGENEPGGMDPVGLVNDARALTGLIYFAELSTPLVRTLRMNEQGELELLKHSRYFQYADGQIWEDSERRVATREQKRKALALYEQAVRQCALERKNGKRTDAPMTVVGVVLPRVAKVAAELNRSLMRLYEGYEQKASDIAAVAYLELALVKKDLGDQEGYKQSVLSAVKELELPKMDYRADVAFRAHMLERFNFARPESCLLFLAAEDARLDKRFGEAQQQYRILIEMMPGSPFAWEALANMSVMPDTDPKEIERLKQLLLDTYPLIWGCPRPGLELDKEAFAAQLPALLKEAGEEEADQQKKPQGTTAGSPVDDGFVFFDGKYLAPPYVVSRRGLGVFVNDKIIETETTRYGDSPEQIIVQRLNLVLRQYEKRLEEGYCYFFFSQGGEISLETYIAAYELPRVVRMLRSDAPVEAKLRELQRMNWHLGIGAGCLETLVENFSAPQDFDERLQELGESLLHAEEFGTTVGSPINKGFVFFDGHYLDAPYIVTRKGLAIVINDKMLEPPIRLAREETPSRDVDPEIPPEISRETSLYDDVFTDYISPHYA